MTDSHVLWLRHAEVARHQDAIHVGDGSHVPAAALRAARVKLAGLEINRPGLILSSPLRRAVQTARLVSEVFGAPRPLTDAVFKEWRPPNCVFDLPASEEPWFYGAWRSHRVAYPRSSFDGSESISAFARRAELALSLVSSVAADRGNVVVVSHKVLIGGVVAIHGGASTASEIFHRATKFRLSNLGSIWLSC